MVYTVQNVQQICDGRNDRIIVNAMQRSPMAVLRSNLQCVHFE